MWTLFLADPVYKYEPSWFETSWETLSIIVSLVWFVLVTSFYLTRESLLVKPGARPDRLALIYGWLQSSSSIFINLKLYLILAYFGLLPTLAVDLDSIYSSSKSKYAINETDFVKQSTFNSNQMSESEIDFDKLNKLRSLILEEVILF